MVILSALSNKGVTPVLKAPFFINHFEINLRNSNLTNQTNYHSKQAKYQSLVQESVLETTKVSVVSPFTFPSISHLPSHEAAKAGHVDEPNGLKGYKIEHLQLLQ